MALTDSLIKESFKRSKWQEQLQRMREARKSIDYYNYRQNEDGQTSYMKERISLMFPQTASDMLPYIRCYPITEQIINDISILFNKPPIITVNPDQKLQPDSPLVSLFMREIVQKPMLNPLLISINRLVNLTYKVGVMPRWYEKGVQLEYVLLTPDRCFVIQDQDSPAHITAICYQVDTLVDTPAAVIPANEWVMVTDEEVSRLKVDINTGTPTLLNSEPNPYGVIPVAWFQNQLPLDGFWQDKGSPIIDANEAYNVNKTLEKLAITYQMYSTLVVWGVPIDKNITWGVKAVMNLGISDDPTKQPGDAKYITPDPKLEQVSNIIEGEVNSTAGYAGLSEEAYRKKTNSFTSGYHLELSKQDVINNNELEMPFYTAGIRDLLKYACLVYSAHSSSDLSAAADFNIDYSPLTFKKNPLEQCQQWTIERQLGISSPVDWLMDRNPDLTREAAEAELARIQQENDKYKRVNPLDSLFNPDEEKAV